MYKRNCLGQIIEQDLEERFLDHCYKVKNGCVETTWKKTQRGGHTLVKVNGKNKQAHRVSYELFVGLIP